MKKEVRPILYEVLSSALAAMATYGYVVAKDLYLSNWFFVVIMASLFAYLFKLITDFALDTVIATLTKPRKLAELDLSDGIPEEHKAAIVYTVYATEQADVEAAMVNIERSLVQNRGMNNPDDHLVAIYASDTRDLELVRHEIKLIKDLQRRYGKDKFFYTHRTSNWGRKWGNYQDLMEWLYEGKVYPDIYLYEKYKNYRRDPNEPVYSVLIGDIQSLHIGDARGCIRYLLISDADVVWPAGTARKTVAKMAHPSNEVYGIFQPLIRISNSDDSLYTQLAFWSRELLRFSELAFWKVHDRCQFYGKGGIKIQQYISKLMKPGSEVLDPDTLSHDFRESVHLPTALLTDVIIEEQTVTDYFQELERLRRWTIGDLQGIGKEVVFRNTLVGWYRRLRGQEVAHLPPLSWTERKIMALIIRLTLGAPLFALWLLGTILAAVVPGLMLTWNKGLEETLYISAIVGVIAMPKFLAPMTARLHTRAYQSSKMMQRLLRDLGVGLVEFIFSTLVFMQFLYDKPIAICRAWAAIHRGRSGQQLLPWSPMRLRQNCSNPMTARQTYRKRIIPTILGAALLAGLVTIDLDIVWLLRWSPIWLSFLLGPTIICYTGRSIKAQGLSKLFTMQML